MNTSPPARADHPAVTVIIVNYNSGDRLRRCLLHLKAQSFRDFEVIIIDNASTDASLESAADLREDFTLIDAGANLGFAAANNKAARAAKGEWLAFLNPDAYADPEWLAALTASVARYPGIDAFGSTQINDADRTMLDGAGDVYHALGWAFRGLYGAPVQRLPADGECFAPCAAAALVRRSTFETLGGFYEPFFCYSEDVDFGFRLRLAGRRSAQIRDAVVFHEGSGVTGVHSDFTVYHGHRNRLWTYYLNMPFLLLAITLPFHTLMNLALFPLMALRGNAAAYVRAMRDGYGGLARLNPERRRRQKERVATTADIARAMSWSPLKLLSRSAHIRPFN